MIILCNLIFSFVTLRLYIYEDAFMYLHLFQICFPAGGIRHTLRLVMQDSRVTFKATGGKLTLHPSVAFSTQPCLPFTALKW